MRSSFLFVAVTASACAYPVVVQPLTMNASASGSEYGAFVVQQGVAPATLHGQAFLKTRGGDVKLGAGNPVTIDPATAYAKEWYEKIGFQSQGRFGEMPPDTLFRTARKSSVVDAQGKFDFPNLAPGKYIVRSIVSWDVPGAYGISNIQGGIVSAIIELKTGETRTVILNEQGNAFFRIP